MGPQSFESGFPSLATSLESTVTTAHPVPDPRHPRPTRRALAALLSLALLLAPAVGAQELFVDAVDVNVVNVEVVVTDADGRPVTDLTAADFRVLEDGEPVEITNFYAVDRRAAAAAAAEGAEAADLPLPLDATRQLHLVILVDQDGLQPQNRAALFAGLREDIDRAFALDGQVMVATLHNGVHIAVPFTNDREKVLAALDELSKVASSDGLDTPQRMLIGQIDRSPTPPPPGDGGIGAGAPLSNQGNFEGAVDNALNIATSIRSYAEREVAMVRNSLDETARLVDSLAGLPGRKAMLFLTEGVSRRPADFLVEVWREKFERWFDSGFSALRSGQLMEKERTLQLVASRDFDTSDEIAEMVRHAAARKVAFYPIAPRGRSSLQGTVTLGTGGTLAQLDAFEKQESLIELAAGTGGVAWTNTQNVGSLLDRVAQDFEHFYSLGYQPPRDDTGTYHRLEVEVTRPGLELRHVAGYRLQDPAERLRDLTLAALQFGVEENPLGIALETTASEPAGNKQSLVTLHVTIPYDRLLLLPEQDSHKARLRLVVIVRDEATGGTSEPHEIELPVSIPNHMLLEALSKTAIYPMQLRIEEGAKQIAVGIRDELARVDSTARLGVVVEAAG